MKRELRECSGGWLWSEATSRGARESVPQGWDSSKCLHSVTSLTFLPGGIFVVFVMVVCSVRKL